MTKFSRSFVEYVHELTRLAQYFVRANATLKRRPDAPPRNEFAMIKAVLQDRKKIFAKVEGLDVGYLGAEIVFPLLVELFERYFKAVAVEVLIHDPRKLRSAESLTFERLVDLLKLADDEDEDDDMPDKYDVTLMLATHRVEKASRDGIKGLFELLRGFGISDLIPDSMNAKLRSAIETRNRIRHEHRPRIYSGELIDVAKVFYEEFGGQIECFEFFYDLAAVADAKICVKTSIGSDILMHEAMLSVLWNR